MTLVSSELIMIRKAQSSARILLDQRSPISEVDVFFNGAPNFDTTITQQDIDDQFPGSGLTVAGLGDAIFAMKLAKEAVDNAMVALAIVANLP